MKRSEAILMAAEALFAERGYDRTSLRDIADLAKVASGTIIYHYGRKERLLSELALRHLHSLLERCRDEASKGASGRERVELFIRATCEHQRRHRRSWALLFRNPPREKPANPGQGEAALNAARHGHCALLESLIIMGAADGSIRTGNAFETAQAILAMLYGGAWLSLFQDGDPKALAHGAVHCARLLMADLDAPHATATQKEGELACSRT